jgi:hypothetical protein
MALNSPASVPQKSLNRFGASAALTSVLAIDRCPSQLWIAPVSGWRGTQRIHH